MTRFLGSLILFLMFTVVAHADYVFSNGFYYWNGGTQPYTRTQSYGYYNGCYCYYYNYTPYYAPAAAYTPPVTSTTPDWRTKVLDIAAASKENEYFMQAINALGIKASPTAFAQSYSQGYAAQQYFVPQASTVYGHYQQDRAVFYGDTDLMALYQMANRQVENTQKLTASSNDAFAALVNQAAQNARDTSADRARQLEILAKAQALSQALDAARRSLDEKKTVIESKGQDFKIVPAPQPAPQAPLNPQGNVPAVPNNEGLEKLGALFQRDCASCHSDAKKGGLDLRDWPNFDSTKKMLVWQRVTTTDNDKAMPRTKDNTVGKRWSVEEARLLLTN